MLQRTPGTFLVSSKLRGPAPLNTALGRYRGFAATWSAPLRVRVVALALVMLGCAGPESFERFVSESPPCHLPPLTEKRVLAAALDTLGASFLQVEGLPERPYRITSEKCVYRFEYSVLSHHDRWLSLDAIHATGELWVARDLRTWKLTPREFVSPTR